MKLRETSNFVATRSKRGVRIAAKDRDVIPRSRVVTEKSWTFLEPMNDDSFDGSCVLELGIGTYRR